jgi:hypothetical protein
MLVGASCANKNEEKQWRKISHGVEMPSSTTAAGNARSAATVANKLPEPSACPAGRRFAAALWLGHNIVINSNYPLGRALVNLGSCTSANPKVKSV